MKRAVKPRAPVVVRPAHVSQLNCEAILGIDPRRFLELLVPRCAHVSIVGKLRVISVEDADDALRSLATDSSELAATEVDVNGDDDEIGTADDVLRRLGRRRTA
jgi:hypothetical protein